jgi:hypothetical protein
MVKRRWIVAIVALIACAACATVADIEVNRTPGDESPGGDSDDGGSIEEGGGGPKLDAGADAPVETVDSEAPVLACNCDAGSSCCIRSSAAPACDVPSCTEPGSLVVGCVRSTTDGRDCCWKPDAGTAQASFGSAGCSSETAACQTNADCGDQGGKCTTLTCKGVTVGVCAAAAPSWFVCPP